MRFIDGDSLIEKAMIKSERQYLEVMVASLPSINLVRCKECKFKRLYDEGDTKYCYCALEDRPNRQWSIDETDFCSWGERREP